jgi:small subunit ribosomal protein S11
MKSSRKTFKKRGEKRVAHHGYAHPRPVRSPHTITDTGERDRVVERRHRLQGLAQGHAVRGDAGGHERGNAAKTHGLRSVEVKVKGPGSGRESAIPRCGVWASR